MRGSPPQTDTIGASHSMAAWRHCSSGTMSLSEVEYSRMRPQPVQVRLQVCNGSNWRTMANFGVLRSLCLTMWLAIFFVSANGKRINDYWTEANSLESSLGNTAGALVAGGVLFFKMPGIKKSMGETV